MLLLFVATFHSTESFYQEIYGPRTLWPVWPLTCLTFDLFDLWPVWPLTCLTLNPPLTDSIILLNLLMFSRSEVSFKWNFWWLCVCWGLLSPNSVTGQRAEYDSALSPTAPNLTTRFVLQCRTWLSAAAHSANSDSVLSSPTGLNLSIGVAHGAYSDFALSTTVPSLILRFRSQRRIRLCAANHSAEYDLRCLSQRWICLRCRNSALSLTAQNLTLRRRPQHKEW